MAFLTKEECIRRHRLLWNYIADQFEEQEEIFLDYKEEAFEHFGWNVFIGRDFSYCWACYYNKMKRLEMVDDPKCAEVRNCQYCLFDWNKGEYENNYCGYYHTLFDQFLDSTFSKNWKEASRIAREIANMPVREDV